MSKIVYIAEKPQSCYDCVFCFDGDDGTYCDLTGYKVRTVQCPLPEVDDNTAELLLETIMDGGFNAREF